MRETKLLNLPCPMHWSRISSGPCMGWSPFQLQITASVRKRPLRATWATIIFPRCPQRPFSNRRCYLYLKRALHGLQSWLHGTAHDESQPCNNSCICQWFWGSCPMPHFIKMASFRRAFFSRVFFLQFVHLVEQSQLQEISSFIVGRMITFVSSG